MPTMMLPAKKGTCPICASAHDGRFAHNLVSLHYQYAFRDAFGRWPKWWDAAATLPDLHRVVWFDCVKIEHPGRWPDTDFEPPPGVDAAAFTEQIRAWEQSINPGKLLPMKDILQATIVPLDDVATDGEPEDEAA